MKLRPEKVWWHVPFDGACGAVVVADMPPSECACKSPQRWADFGWRVGQHSSNHSYYSTYEHAAQDRRCK